MSERWRPDERRPNCSGERDEPVADGAAETYGAIVRSVTVRWARVDDAPVDASWLGPGEASRLAAFRDDDDRRRFVGVRLLLRHVVAATAGCAPEEVVLRQRCARCGGPHGRPVVAAGGRALEVSMAHAGSLAVVALCRSPVGVDVEPHGLDSLVSWVRIEAVLKATGLGLDVDPSLLDVGGAGSQPRLRTWAGPGRKPALRLADLAPVPGYVAAVARLGRRPLRIDAAAVTVAPAR